jgi:hypothetical protein
MRAQADEFRHDGKQTFFIVRQGIVVSGIGPDCDPPILDASSHVARRTPFSMYQNPTLSAPTHGVFAVLYRRLLLQGGLSDGSSASLASDQIDASSNDQQTASSLTHP